jgi:hypothetical protein
MTIGASGVYDIGNGLVQRRSTMRTLFAALGLLVAASAADTASAIEYPWCADLGKELGATNCGFATLEQCRATVSGIGGSCTLNPFYRAAVIERPVRPARPAR